MPSEMKSLDKWIFRCLIRARKATTQSETLRWPTTNAKKGAEATF